MRFGRHNKEEKKPKWFKNRARYVQRFAFLPTKVYVSEFLNYPSPDEIWIWLEYHWCWQFHDYSGIFGCWDTHMRYTLEAIEGPKEGFQEEPKKKEPFRQSPGLKLL